MPSRSSSTEKLSKSKDFQQILSNTYMENTGRIKMKRRQTEKSFSAESDTILRSPNLDKKQKNYSKKGEDLSRDDLLFLLSVLEGELQAQDEVIGVLKAEKINLALLEAQYGFVTPKKVLEALQRDAIQSKATLWQEDIYEKPMGELDKVIEKHKETHRRMLEQLLMVEKSHRQTLYDLEDEKRKHAEYMEKSDEFTNLLEQEQERITPNCNSKEIQKEQMVNKPLKQFQLHPLKKTKLWAYTFKERNLHQEQQPEVQGLVNQSQLRRRRW